MTRQELLTAVNELKTATESLLEDVSILSPAVTKELNTDDIRRFEKVCCDNWIKLNKETLDILNDSMIELQLEDYSNNFIDKIRRLSEGLELLAVAIDKNCEELDENDTLDKWYLKIHN